MPEQLDLNNTFGAFLISVVVSAALFGVICVQTYYYFQNYSSDNLYVKVVVLILLALESLHSIFNTYAVYYYTITNYINPVALLDSTWSLSTTLALSCAVVVIVHMFYIRRVYYMSHKNTTLVTLIMFLVLARFGTGITVIVKAFQFQHFSVSAQIIPYVDAALSLSLTTDITIAASLTFYLHRSRCGNRNTDTMINRLMVYTINNGILTSTFGILIIIFVTTQPGNLIHIAIYQTLGNLYTNSMLATLNSRRSMTRAAENTGMSFRFPTSLLSGTKPGDIHIIADDVERQLA